MTLILYTVTVLIWGTTWIAIAMQVGEIPLIVSVFYRFALAALVLVGALAVTGKLKIPELRHHPYLIVLALGFSSINFVLLYNAALYIPSGLIAVIFSFSTIYNAVNARIFFGELITRRVIIASVLGLTGLVLIFLPDVFNGQSLSTKTLVGIAYAASGTLLFSFGNMAARRNSMHGISTLVASAWGMMYGVIIMIITIMVTSSPVIMPNDIYYTAALIYLAVFGSVIGLTAYFLLIVRVGSSQAAYATVLFPIVAIVISVVFEDYQLKLATVIGMMLAVAGNVVMFAKFKGRGK